MCEDPTWIEMSWVSIWLRVRSTYDSTLTLEGPWPHYIILEVSWDGLWTLSLGLSQSHGHGSRLVCEVALRPFYEAPVTKHSRIMAKVNDNVSPSSRKCQLINIRGCDKIHNSNSLWTGCSMKVVLSIRSMKTGEIRIVLWDRGC